MWGLQSLRADTHAPTHMAFVLATAVAARRQGFDILLLTGAKTPDADPAKALAVRQAIAHLVDRDVIASQVFKNTYTPVYSYVPKEFEGATEPLKSLYGDGSGKPSLEKAKKVLADAGA